MLDPSESRADEIIDICCDDLLVDEDDDINPMKNPVVLAHLFELCKLSDLLRFRLVSKQWYLLSLTRFRDETLVEINHTNTEEVSYAFRWGRNRLHWLTMDEKLHPGEKKFKTFRLREFQFFDSPPTQVSLQYVDGEAIFQPIDNYSEERERIYANMITFWDKFGQWIRRLELDNSEIYSVDCLKGAIFEKLPNLEDLKLAGLRNFEGELDNGQEGELVRAQPHLKYLMVTLLTILPISWRLIFLHFPNIQGLELQHFNSLEAFPPVLDTLEQLSASGEFRLNIQNLKLRNVCTDANLYKRLFQLPHFKLSTLFLDMEGCEDDSQSVLPTVILLHRQTLKDLHLTNCRFGTLVFTGLANFTDSPPYDNFPFQEEPLLSLTKLRLDGYFLKNFHFLEKLPNLKVLTVEEYFGEKMLPETDFVRMMNMRLPRLREFHFDVNPSEYCLGVEEMEMFVKVMPNMDRFSGQLDNSSLMVVCRNWIGLRELSINTEGVDDEGVTGISMSAGSEERHPNIGDLKNLQKLIITGGDISDVSAWNVFLKLEHLRYLQVQLSPQTSDDAMTALRKKFHVGPFRYPEPPRHNNMNRPTDGQNNAS